MSGGAFAIKDNVTDFARDILERKRKVDAAPLKFYTRAVVAVDKWIQGNFKSEGKMAMQGGWKPLTAGAILSRMYHTRSKYAGDLAAYKALPKGERQAFLEGKRGHFRILQRDAKLKGTWRHIVQDDYAAVVSGVKDNYGTYHDEGGKKLPQRKVTPTPSQMSPLLRPILERILAEAVK